MREEFDDYQREEQQRSLLEAEMAQGETILWQGAPQGRVKVQGAGVLRVFGLFWLGFSLFWELSALSPLFTGNLMGIFFPLFGLPFVGVGVWLVFLQPRRLRRQMESALYAVTDRRGMVPVSYTHLDVYKRQGEGHADAQAGKAARPGPDGQQAQIADGDAGGRQRRLHHGQQRFAVGEAVGEIGFIDKLAVPQHSGPGRPAGGIERKGDQRLSLINI